MLNNTNSIKLASIAKNFSRIHGCTVIFDNISYTFNQGTSYALTGSSGSGKSTLLHCIAGLEPVSTGSIYINEVLLTPAMQHVVLQSTFGLMFQSPYLINELTSLDNVVVKGYTANIKKNILVGTAVDLLTRVGLENHIYDPVWMLSGGQQQRVALARALIAAPQFIIADEPTGNLDQTTGMAIMDLLLEYKQNHGMGIIIATHDMVLAQKMDVQLELKDLKLHEKQ